MPLKPISASTSQRYLKRRVTMLPRNSGASRPPPAPASSWQTEPSVDRLAEGLLRDDRGTVTNNLQRTTKHAGVSKLNHLLTKCFVRLFPGFILFFFSGPSSLQYVGYFRNRWLSPPMKRSKHWRRLWDWSICPSLRVVASVCLCTRMLNRQERWRPPVKTFTLAEMCTQTSAF